mmetsp:Transcript_21633/g.74294  ORF Transcript_21633/g.74294 Transcript_21633/m.74294 type:complete len:244 (-) Transcript_21633:932-1663(-)
MQSAYAVLKRETNTVLVHDARPTEIRLDLHALIPRRAEVSRQRAVGIAVGVGVARGRSRAKPIDAASRRANLKLDTEASFRGLRSTLARAHLELTLLLAHAKLAKLAIPVAAAPVVVRALSSSIGVLGNLAELPLFTSAIQLRRARLARPRAHLVRRQRVLVSRAILARHAILIWKALEVTAATCRQGARAVDAVVSYLAVLQSLADAAAHGGAGVAGPPALALGRQRGSKLLALRAALAVIR